MPLIYIYIGHVLKTSYRLFESCLLNWIQVVKHECAGEVKGMCGQSLQPLSSYLLIVLPARSSYKSRVHALNWGEPERAPH